ncbi:hypothetical protein IPH70_02230 [Candidatus Roizmanbacteria bacterium]|nr:MAG: hypothetical protein IPH70_02230 [Candidatus Roizmanbacteria bacterium]
MKKILSIIFLIVLSAVLLTATLRGEYGNHESIPELSRLNAETLPFESSHERAPYAEMLAIKDRGTIELGKELGLFASPDAGYDGDKIYSFFPSGVSYLILGGYIIGQNYNLGSLSAFAVMGLLTVGTIILIFLISRNIFKLPIWASILAPLTFAFATTAWSYSITIYQHAPTAFIAMLMFYLTWKYKNAKNSLVYLYAILVGSLYALALFIDYPNALTLSPLGVYFFASSFSTESLKNKVKINFKPAFL